MTELVNGFKTFLGNFVTLGNSITSVLSYILSIVKTLWFGVTSLLSGVGNLINEVFTGGVFDSVGFTFNQLSSYIGVGGVIFMSTLLLIAIFRIGISFVFKLFRLNVDYKPKTPGENKTYVIYNLKGKK